MNNLNVALKRQTHVPQATRRSLLSRLKSWDDQSGWQQFFDTYWRLIYSVACRAGLTESEAQDVVQETVLSVAKQIAKFKYDPTVCSFKGWLLTLARRRIADQYRKRSREMPTSVMEPDSDRSTSLLDRIQSKQDSVLETIWNEEWQSNLLAAALERVKRKANPKGYEAFYLYVIRGQPVTKVAKATGINVAQVYLAKHRITRLLKKEMRDLETTFV